MATHTQTGMLPHELLCLNCQSRGRVASNVWHCQSCETMFDFEIRCASCKATVQRLTGCSCSEHFYCRDCQSPQSRRSVLYEMNRRSNDSLV